jgi:hypothetical protein
MRYSCSLFVQNVPRFTGVYADANIAAQDICCRASSYAEFPAAPDVVASDIERGATTIDLRLRAPQVHIEVRKLVR